MNAIERIHTEHNAAILELAARELLAVASALRVGDLAYCEQESYSLRTPTSVVTADIVKRCSVVVHLA